MYNAIFASGKMENFLSDPENMESVLHYTPDDERDVYGEVNPDKNPQLNQAGKVVVVTGAGRGLGRLSASIPQ